MFALATTNNHDTEASTVVTTTDPDYSQTSIPDEDPLDEAVTNPNVLAEVALPTKPSMFFTGTTNVFFKLLTTNRI